MKDKQMILISGATGFLRRRLMKWLKYRKAEKLLGWQSKTSLEQGLKKTIDFYKKAVL